MQAVKLCSNKILQFLTAGANQHVMVAKQWCWCLHVSIRPFMSSVMRTGKLVLFPVCWFSLAKYPSRHSVSQNKTQVAETESTKITTELCHHFLLSFDQNSFLALNWVLLGPQNRTFGNSWSRYFTSLVTQQCQGTKGNSKHCTSCLDPPTPVTVERILKHGHELRKQCCYLFLLL